MKKNKFKTLSDLLLCTGLILLARFHISLGSHNIKGSPTPINNTRIFNSYMHCACSNLF
uniref:Uncharacterized protein n=1 Tax=Anguilla anguilla TaxID=7936 RepID=A0A0E9SQE9_ANGAN